jgi:hypothetical protein
MLSSSFSNEINDLLLNERLEIIFLLLFLLFNSLPSSDFCLN